MSTFYWLSVSIQKDVRFITMFTTLLNLLGRSKSVAPLSSSLTNDTTLHVDPLTNV